MFLNIPRLEADVLLTPRLTLKLEDHSLSAVPNILFNKFAATIHIGGWGGGRSLIGKLKTRHAVVTGTPLTRNIT